MAKAPDFDNGKTPITFHIVNVQSAVWRRERLARGIFVSFDLECLKKVLDEKPSFRPAGRRCVIARQPFPPPLALSMQTRAASKELARLARRFANWKCCSASLDYRRPSTLPRLAASAITARRLDHGGRRFSLLLIPPSRRYAVISTGAGALAIGSVPGANIATSRGAVRPQPTSESSTAGEAQVGLDRLSLAFQAPDDTIGHWAFQGHRPRQGISPMMTTLEVSSTKIECG